MNWRAFISGMGSILDLSGGAFSRPRRKLRYAQTDAEAFEQDARAVASDWETVGRDLQVLGCYRELDNPCTPHRKDGRTGWRYNHPCHRLRTTQKQPRERECRQTFEKRASVHLLSVHRL